MKKTPREQVLEYYPNAIAIKIRRHYEIFSDRNYLGQGKSAANAWKAASRNIDD
jgi:hypothetical protein